MKLKYRLSMLISVAVALALATSFLVSTPKKSLAADASTLTVAFAQEPDTLNQYYSNMAFAQWAVFLIQADLWDYDDKLQPVPVLVKEVPSAANGGISKDGKTITLKLKPGLKWSDGQPLNAHDVAFTFNMISEKANNFIQSATAADQVTKVEEVDDTTVKLTTKDPNYPELIAGVLGPFYPLPAHIYEPIFKNAKAAPATAAPTPEGTAAAAAPAGLLETADENQNPTVFSGAYMLKEWKRGESLTFVPNPNYVGGKPKIQTIIIKIFPDPQASYAALAAGQIDWLPNLQPPDTKTIGDLFKDPKQVNFFSIYGSYVEALWPNLQVKGNGPKPGNPALLDPQFRHALEMGINRKGLIHDLQFDKVGPVETFYGGSPFEDKSVKFVDYDPAGAEKLLDSLGYKKGADGIRAKGDDRLELTFASTKAAVRGKNLQYMQQDLAKIGIKVNIQQYDATTFFSTYPNQGIMNSGTGDVFEYANNGAFTNPVIGRQFTCDQIVTDKLPDGQNPVGYCNKDFDKQELITENPTDPKAGQAAANELQKIWAKDVPLIILYARADIYAYLSARFVKPPHIGAGVSNMWYDVLNWELK